MAKKPEVKPAFKIAIASGKGGVGKSMLTSSLALLFNKDYNVIACDCDVDAPNLALWLNESDNWDEVYKISTAERPEFNYKKCISCGRCAEVCQFDALTMENEKPQLDKFTCEGCGACEIVCSTKAIKFKAIKNGEIKIKKTKKDYILISGQLYPGETGSGRIVTEVKKKADKFINAKNKTLNLVDSSPGTGCPLTAALRDVNYVILITEPTPSGLHDLKRVLQIVDHFRLPYGLVVNKWDLYPNFYEKIKKIFKDNILGRISYDQNILKAVANLIPIMETDLKAREEIKKIFGKLNSVIKLFN